MANEQKSSGAHPIVLVLVGAILMVGGMWLSQNWHPDFIASLAEQGIPLDLGKTVAVIGVFLILFPVIRFFFINPLAEAIHDRNQELERTFSDAENLRTEMSNMKTEYEQRLAQTEASAREQIQAQIKEAQTLRQQLMAEATAKADELVKKAQEEINLERDKVMTQLRVEVVNLTLQATERLLGESMDDSKNRRLVEDFVSKVEVPS